MAPTLVGTPIYVEDAVSDAAALVTGSFTPNVGELLVLKAANGDANQTFNAPTNTGFTVNAWTSRVNSGTGGTDARAAIWTAQVTASAAGTVSLTIGTGTQTHAMVLERWQETTWQLAGTPATVGTDRAATPWTTTITTTGTGSIVTWVGADYSAVSPAGWVYAGSPTQDHTPTAIAAGFSANWSYQAAASPGAQTLGLTSGYTGANYNIAGLEIQDGGAIAAPVPTLVMARTAY